MREFLSSLRAVLAGQGVVPRVLARAVSGARSGGRERAAPLISPLTPREHQVL